MRFPRHMVVLVVAVLVGAGLVVGTGATPKAVAATETTSFETSPGLTRTNLVADFMDFDPVSGLLYAVSDAGGVATLFAVDIDTLEVVANTLVGDGQLQVYDVDVSRDGRTIFIATSEGVVSYQRSSLTILRIVPVEGGDPTRIAASPDNPDRFIVEFGARSFISDDGVLIDLADLTSPNIEIVIPPQGPVSWGMDSSTVFASDFGDIYRVEVEDPPVAVAVQTVLVSGLVYPIVPTIQNDRLLYAGKILDPLTLEIEGDVEQVAQEWRWPIDDGSGPIILRTDGDPPIVWGRFDESDLSLASTWTLPVGPIEDEWSTLAGARFAILERADSGSYITVGDSNRLGSGYGEFTPLQPSRVLDTRTGVGRNGILGKLDADQTVTVQMEGRGGLPDDSVMAVVLNATVTAPTQSSFFSIWPSGQDRPGVSNLNFGAGQQIANLVTVAVGADGAVQLSNEFGSAHALLDVVGYYGDETAPRGARYAPVVVTERLVDTRASEVRDATTLQAGTTRTFGIESFPTARPAGNGEVTAVVLNVTAVRPTEAGFLTVWPDGNPKPTASNLNFAPGDIRANLVVVAVGDDDRVSVYNPFGSVDLLVDVFGVYETFGEDRLDQQGKFLPVEPFRRFDSRISSPFDAPGSLAENTSLLNSSYQGWTDLWNVTAVRPTSDGFLSVLGWDDEFPNTDFPSTSNVNFKAGETVANAVYALGAPDTEVYNPFGRTHLLIDVFGYLTPEVQRPIEEVWGARP